MIPQIQSSQSGRSLMQLLATDEDLDGIKLDGDKLIDKTKLFIIAQAKNELNRVIKMTDFLDKLEEKFVLAVDQRLEQNPDNLQLISSAMEVVTESLSRSNVLISQVLKDDKLTSLIINTTNIITSDGKSSVVIDADSRDAVRNMASSLISQLTSLSDKPDITGNDSAIDVIIEEKTTKDGETDNE